MCAVVMVRLVDGTLKKGQKVRFLATGRDYDVTELGVFTPHLTPLKENACGCAGVFNSPNTLECLAQVFEEEGALDQLEAFASRNGPGFYGLPVNEGTLTLTKGDAPVIYPDKIETGEGPVTVFDPGMALHWQVSAG